MENSLPDIKSMNKTELTDFIKEKGFPAFRAKQIYDWMHVKLVKSISDMTNIPKDLRQYLENNTHWIAVENLACQESKRGDTKKFLFGLDDGNAIESVWMKYKHGNSVCISSQVGCRMGCTFCASTIGGLVRNLTPSEMLEQVYEITRATGERVSNIVVMGCGEPLDNFDTLIKFIDLITNADGLNISQRNITVSTCGLVPKIRQLADYELNITLAISLHACNDEKRRCTMPVARSYTIAEIMDACRYYFKKTGRRISFEYALIEGVNDTKEDWEGLSRLLKGENAHVNLIPVNPVKERDYRRTAPENVAVFQQMLEKNGINGTIRREMGADIDAACGQLRRSYEKGLKENTEKG